MSEEERNDVQGLELDPNDLETLVDMLKTYRFLQNYMNDETLKGIADVESSMFKLLNAMISTDFVDVLERGLQEPEFDKALLDPPQLGMMGIIRELKDEDVQRGIGIMMELLKAIGKASTENNEFKSRH
jgi:uncharacterized protein YjgD (DUF1641 family)